MPHQITRILDKKSNPATINRRDAIAKGLAMRKWKLKFGKCKISKAPPSFSMPTNGQIFCAKRYAKNLDRFLG